jgi:hypothetical protein
MSNLDSEAKRKAAWIESCLMRIGGVEDKVRFDALYAVVDDGSNSVYAVPEEWSFALGQKICDHEEFAVKHYLSTRGHGIQVSFSYLRDEKLLAELRMLAASDKPIIGSTGQMFYVPDNRRAAFEKALAAKTRQTKFTWESP